MSLVGVCPLPRTSARPQASPLLGSGGAALCAFLPAVPGGTGRRAPALGREGQGGSGGGGWVFSCQKWTFCLPNGAGWRAGGSSAPRSCYTPSFVCAWSEILQCCRLGSRLGPAPPGAATGLRPPCRSRPGELSPIAFIFTRAGLSLTFVCGEDGGVLVIWKDERQMGMTRGLPYSLACERNSVLNKSLTG